MQQLVYFGENAYNGFTLNQRERLMDVVIRNANLADGQHGVDVAIEHGRIAAIGRACRWWRRRRSMPAAIC
jgi:urease alpha subunit